MIIIEKRVSLDFLGEKYKDAYVIFKALPVSEYKVLFPKIEKHEGNRLEMIQILLDVIKEKFISGKFPGDDGLTDLKKDDLDSFDEATLAECYSYISGQKLDPKLSGQ